jgi:hypothetical protein
VSAGACGVLAATRRGPERPGHPQRARDQLVRALILVDQEQYEPALAYSEKALAILTVTLKNKSKELVPFLDDNRKIREKLGRR